MELDGAVIDQRHAKLQTAIEPLNVLVEKILSPNHLKLIQGFDWVEENSGLVRNQAADLVSKWMLTRYLMTWKALRAITQT